MEANYRTIHKEWAVSLLNHGVSRTVYLLLDAFKPLAYFSAQMVYTGKPILAKFLPETQIDAAGSLLDDPEELNQFMQLLDTKAQNP
jgi:hypothetical protein